MFKSNNRKVLTTIFIFAFFILSLFVYQSVLTNNLQKEMTGKVGEITSQNKQVINEKIEDTFNLLNESKQHVMEYYYKNGEFDQEGCIASFSSIVSRQSFFRMGIVLEDGTVFTTRGKDINIYNRPYIQEALKGEQYISDVFTDYLNNKPTIVLSMPLEDNNHIIGAIFIGYDIESFRNELSVYSFNDDGYSYIVKSNGDAVVDSIHEGSFVDFTNLYQSLENASSTNKSCIEDLKQKLGKEESGSFIFTNKIEKYCYYLSLGINDWYLLTVVPKEAIEYNSNLVLTITGLFFLVLVMLFLWLLFVLYSFLNEKNKELEKIVYEDKITNKMSFEKFKKEVPKFFKNLKLNEKAALLYLDIDNFKLINDFYGYDAGNQTICFMADTISTNISSKDIFARVFADRFVVLIAYKDHNELVQKIEKLLNDLKDFSIENDHYLVRAIAGVYEIENYDDDFEFMNNCAKIAHTNIKSCQDIDYAFYSNAMRLQLVQNKSLENAINQGIAKDEFVAYYQPKVDSITKEVIGSEALIRWNSKNGLLAPGKFIGVAETTGQIIALDERVFVHVCKDIKELLNQHKKVVPVSVNVSKKTLYHPDFVNRYKSIIEEYQVPTQYIQLEITESLLYIDSTRTNKIIDELHEMGIKILMDDFGTGYSSLLMLKDIPIDILKLDKSFIDGYQNEKGSQILKATIDLAHSIQMNTIAEGVETQDQYEYLKKLKCEVIQGYYFSKPIDKETYNKMINKE